LKIQTKIISTVIAITLVINIIFQYNNIRLQKKSLILQLSNKIEKTTELLSRINAGPIFYYDEPLIETNIKSFLKDPEIKSIYVLETSGEIDLYFENPDVGIDNLLEVNTDVIYDGEQVGKLIISFSKDVINKELSQKIYTGIVSLIFATFSISISLLLILRKIIKPIKDLTDLSSEISSGNLTKEISIVSNDEIGILSQSFMKMRDSIKEKIQSLSIENEERKKAEVLLTLKTEELAKANSELLSNRMQLEEIVKKRTAELQESLNNLNATKNQLVQSEKMASLGDLVAGVAHEINTPIGIGVTAASHLENETKIFSDNYHNGKVTKKLFENYIDVATESSKMILSNMIRAANLIQSFKKVAVDQSSEEKRKFKLKEYIDEVLLSLHAKFKHTEYKIDIQFENDFYMDSYPGAISQIITNLCMNSLQHGFENQDTGVIIIKLKKINDRATITYSDNGTGIPYEIQKRIFDPFFTTKRGHGGSGLGMNIVFNLINQTLKGSISCDSTPGVGTTFKIEMPVSVD